MEKVKSLAPYNKFLVSVLGAVAQVVAVYYGSNTYVQGALAVLTALGVYQVRNGK